MKVSFSPNIIPSGWLGSRHQLANYLTEDKTAITVTGAEKPVLLHSCHLKHSANMQKTTTNNQADIQNKTKSENVFRPIMN